MNASLARLDGVIERAAAVWILTRARGTMHENEIMMRTSSE